MSESTQQEDKKNETSPQPQNKKLIFIPAPECLQAEAMNDFFKRNGTTAEKYMNS